MNGTYIKNPLGVVSVNRIKRLSTEILNEYQDKKQIIHPILTPKESSLFLKKGKIIPRKINRIIIHDSGHPSDKKKQLIKADREINTA